MLETEAKLFDEYKRVDNICRDIFLGQGGISQYITEMEQKSFYGCSMVSSWDGDYRKLKRVRRLRNQIAHESSGTDCNWEDAAWLEGFHSRLLERRDPLALLERIHQGRLSASPRRGNRQRTAPEQWAGQNARLQKRENFSPKRGAGALIEVAAVLVGLAAAAVFLILCRMMGV